MRGTNHEARQGGYVQGSLAADFATLRQNIVGNTATVSQRADGYLKDSFLSHAARSAQQIRLISVNAEANGPIHCKITNVNLDANSVPDYRAVSYVWGPARLVLSIYVNNVIFVIRQNLHDFLQMFRARLFAFRGCD